jgi:hypothetical protein
MTYEDNIEKFEHHMILYNKTSPRIRLFLGIIHEDEFEVTVETIKYLPDDLQYRLRDYIKSIFNI